MQPGKPQGLIMALLIEAAAETCSDDRRADIRRQLVAATHGQLWATQAVTQMFQGYIKYYPSRLPQAFPFFALFCGTRKPEGLFTEIKWGWVDTDGAPYAEDGPTGDSLMHDGDLC